MHFFRQGFRTRYILFFAFILCVGLSTSGQTQMAMKGDLKGIASVSGSEMLKPISEPDADVVEADSMDDAKNAFLCAFKGQEDNCPESFDGGASSEFVESLNGKMAMAVNADIELHTIFSDPATYGNVSISGNKIIWVTDAESGGGYDLFLCEFDAVANNCPAHRIATNVNLLPYPKISGNNVVYYRQYGSDFLQKAFFCRYSSLDGTCEERLLIEYDSIKGLDIHQGRIAVAVTDFDAWQADAPDPSKVFTCVINDDTLECPLVEVFNIKGNQRYASVHGNVIGLSTDDFGEPFRYADIYLCHFNPLDGSCPPLDITKTDDSEVIEWNFSLTKDKVIWSVLNFGSSGFPYDGPIYVCDYKDGLTPDNGCTTTTIPGTSVNGVAFPISSDGNQIVYSQLMTDDRIVKYHNTVAGTTYELIDSDGEYTQLPAIDGNLVAFEKSLTDSSIHILVAELPYIQTIDPDVNNDGIVEGLDEEILTNLQGTSEGQEGYQVQFDLNMDGVIDSSDLNDLLEYMGRDWPSVNPNEEMKFFIVAKTPAGADMTIDVSHDEMLLDDLGVVLETQANGAVLFRWTPDDSLDRKQRFIISAQTLHTHIAEELNIHVGTTSQCGDGFDPQGYPLPGLCTTEENFDSCPLDCPSTTCGNGICEVNAVDVYGYPIVEDGNNCQADCSATCGGDYSPEGYREPGLCTPDENFDNCQLDCRSTTCGNGICEVNAVDVYGYPIVEDGNNCQADCSATCGGDYSPEGYREPGLCTPDENFDNCQLDCRSTTCGNGICEVNAVDVYGYPIVEDGNNCQADCSVTCGGDYSPEGYREPGLCTPDENFDNCQLDCRSTTCGNGICEVNAVDVYGYPIVEDGNNCQADCSVTCGGDYSPEGYREPGLCTPDENFDNCQLDCRSTTCGNGICEVNAVDVYGYPIVEDGNNCQADCSVTCGGDYSPEGYREPGLCTPDENFDNCQLDCRSTTCGNGICEVNAVDVYGYPIVEDGNNCQADCSPTCGGDYTPEGLREPGLCTQGEDFDNCQLDCPSTSCGNGLCEINAQDVFGYPVTETVENCAVDCASTLAPMLWTDLVGVDVDGNTLTKTAVTGWGNSGAASLQVIPADGGIDFLAVETNTYRLAGLSSANSDASYGSIQYGLFLYADGSVHVYESGSYRGNFGTYVSGDRFQVERIGNAVTYQKNGDVIYTSSLNSNGELIADAALYSSGATIADAKIDGGVQPPNQAPDAEDQSVTVVRDTSKAIALVATDVEGSSLTYSILSGPNQGSLSGTAPNVTYVPNAGYTGSDSFTFKANDGEDDSNAATVSITVMEPPTPITWTDTVGVNVSGSSLTKNNATGWANSGAASLRKIPGNGGIDFLVNETNTFRMAGLSSINADANYGSIHYAMFLYNNGTAHVYESGAYRGHFGTYAAGDRFQVERAGSTVFYKKNGDVLYTSALPSNGNVVADVAFYSSGATIADANINGGVEPPNEAPVAENMSMTTVRNTAIAFTLAATDAENDPLTFNIPSGPTHGVLTGTAPNMIYMPDTGYTGSDSFTFKANDGEDDSNTATVSITVMEPPTPIIWTDKVGVGTSGDLLVKTAATGWGNSGAASLQVIPGDGGIDFEATEANTYRLAGLSSINADASYGSIHYAMFLYNNGTAHVYESGAYRGQIGSYVAGDRFQVERSGSTVFYKKNGDVLYTSALPSNGNLMADVAFYSSGATIADANINGGVEPPNQAPVAENMSMTTVRNTAIAFTLEATDAENDPLTFNIPSGPTHGVLTGTAPNMIYMPDTGYTGSDSFTFKANDGEDDSNTATVSITVMEPPTPIIWTDKVGVGTSGDMLVKTTETGWGNSGAASLQIIPGDGGIDFEATETNTYRMAGLSTINADASYGSVHYAILLYNNGSAHVYESGTYRGQIGSYAAGDRFQVERSGSTVLYKKNGAVLYTSTLPISGNLMADVAFYSSGATIADANITGGVEPPNQAPVSEDKSVGVIQNTSTAMTLIAVDVEGDPLIYSIVAGPSHGSLSGTAPNVTYTPNSGYLGADSFTFKANDGEEDSNVATVNISVTEPPVPVSWTDLVGVNLNGSTLTKTAATGWNNAGGASLEVIPGDGGIDFRADETNTYRIVGLSTGNSDASYGSILYGIFLYTDGSVHVYEHGVHRGTFANFVSGDRFQVEREGSTVYYKKNESVIYTSTLPSSGSLIADASLYSQGATISDVNIRGAE